MSRHVCSPGAVTIILLVASLLPCDAIAQDAEERLVTGTIDIEEHGEEDGEAETEDFGDAVKLNEKDSFEVHNPDDSDPPPAISEELYNIQERRTPAANNGHEKFRIPLGLRYGFEQQVKTACIKDWKTCTRWNSKCSQWAEGWNWKTCTGWTAKCDHMAKTCGEWKFQTRSLIHEPVVVVAVKGASVDDLKKKVENAVKTAATAAIASSFVSSGAAAYPTFIETLRAKLIVDLGQSVTLSIHVEDKAKWSKWSGDRTKKGKKPPKAEKKRKRWWLMSSKTLVKRYRTEAKCKKALRKRDKPDQYACKHGKKWRLVRSGNQLVKWYKKKAKCEKGRRKRNDHQKLRCEK